jgi:transposase
VKAARDAWFPKVAGVKVADLVFLDEFGATTEMTRTRARGPRGERVVCRKPAGRWKVISTIAAMSVRGMLAASSFEGAADTDTFLTFLREELVPQLRPGQVLVLDNLSPHRNPRVDELVKAAGAWVLRLPPCSPDFNPIEMAISKVKSLLRKEAEREVATLMDTIDAALRAVTEQDATSFVRHCGYAVPATGG